MDIRNNNISSTVALIVKRHREDPSVLYLLWALAPLLILPQDDLRRLLRPAQIRRDCTREDDPCQPLPRPPGLRPAQPVQLVVGLALEDAIAVGGRLAAGKKIAGFEASIIQSFTYGYTR